MPKAEVGELQLDYQRSGEGPPLLAIMGMSGTYLHWGEPFLERLRESFEVIVYDHRGVGASSRLEVRSRSPSWPPTRPDWCGRWSSTRCTCWASRWAGWWPRSWCWPSPSSCAR